MFVCPCFIRKNTKEIRVMLEFLGYVRDQSVENFEDYPYIKTLPSYSDSSKKDMYTFEMDIECDGNVYEYRPYNCIDCGENEYLFFAIAGLNDVNDKEQYFISNNDKKFYTFCVKNEFHMVRICTEDCTKFIDDKDNWHKATVDELIELLS